MTLYCIFCDVHEYQSEILLVFSLPLGERNSDV